MSRGLKKRGPARGLEKDHAEILVKENIVITESGIVQSVIFWTLISEIDANDAMSQNPSQKAVTGWMYLWPAKITSQDQMTGAASNATTSTMLAGQSVIVVTLYVENDQAVLLSYIN